MKRNFRGNRNTVKVFTDPSIQVSPGLTDVPPRTAITVIFVHNFRGETSRDWIFVIENVASFVSTIGRFNFNVTESFVQVFERNFFGFLEYREASRKSL